MLRTEFIFKCAFSIAALLVLVVNALNKNDNDIMVVL